MGWASQTLLGLAHPPPSTPALQDGWNILNFLIVFILLLGFFIEQLNTIAITYTLR